MTTLEEIAQRHSDWVKMAQFHGAQYPADVVQEVYIKLAERKEKTGTLDINEGFMFIAIRNTAHKLREAPRNELTDHLAADNTTEINEQRYEALLKRLDKGLVELDSYHRRLFVHMALHGISEREMERQSGISRRSIQHTKRIVREYLAARCRDLYDEL